MNLLEICERVLSLHLLYNKRQREWEVTAILKDGTVWGGTGEDLEEVCKRIPATPETLPGGTGGGRETVTMTDIKYRK